MAINKENKTRITISMSKNVLEKLDNYCEMSGLSRSAVITDIVGTELGVFSKFMDAFPKALIDALSVGRSIESSSDES